MAVEMVRQRTTRRQRPGDPFELRPSRIPADSALMQWPPRGRPSCPPPLPLFRPCRIAASRGRTPAARLAPQPPILTSMSKEVNRPNGLLDAAKDAGGGSQELFDVGLSLPHR